MTDILQGLTVRLLASLLALACFAAPAVAQTPPDAPSCLAEIAKAERRHHIPPGLLVSIGLVESGRREPASGLVSPWPWTINAEGAGRFYDSAEAAMKDAAALLDRNVGLVDVGCLQVDLYHHPHAFKSLRAAFDPAANADYAARHLVGLLEQTGSWTAAAAAYHSGDATLGDPYLARVLYYWKQLGTTAASAAAAPDDPGRHGFLIEDGPSPLDVAADFFARKDYASALAIYRASLANRPDDQAALLGVALCLRQTGRDEDALVYLQKALTIDPTNPAALGTLLRLIDEGPAGRKLARLTSARQVAPQSPPILSRLAFEEAAAGRLSEALADMAAAARLAPDDPIILLDAALLLDRLDQPSAAVKAYELFLRTYRPESAALSIPLKEIRDRQAYLQRGGH